MRIGRRSLMSAVVPGLAVLAMAGIGSSAAAQDASAASCEERPGLVTWDGDAGTAAWAEPTNWAGDVTPGPGSHVCIASAGATVVIDSGPASIASLQVVLGSTLVVAGSGVLDLAGPEPSTLDALVMSGGSLAGAGTRTVTGSAILDTGTLTGAGRTVIAADARLQVGTGNGGALTHHGGHVLALDAGATGGLGPGPP